MIDPFGRIVEYANVFLSHGRNKKNSKDRNHKNTFEKDCRLIYSLNFHDFNNLYW